MLGTPLRMEEQGDLRSVGAGTEGSPRFPPRRQVAHTLANCVSAPWRQRAAYPGMQGPSGSRDHVGTLRARVVAWVPREPPAKCPALAPVAPAASPASCHGAWSCSPGPRFTTGECLLRTPRNEGRGCLNGEGGWSSGGPRSQRSQSLLAEFRPDFREWKLPGPSLPPGGRVGQFEPKQDS